MWAEALGSPKAQQRRGGSSGMQLWLKWLSLERRETPRLCLRATPAFPLQKTPPAAPSPAHSHALPHLRAWGGAGVPRSGCSGARLLSDARPFTTPARTRGLGDSQRDGLLPQSKGSHELAWEPFPLFGVLGADKEPSSTTEPPHELPLLRRTEQRDGGSTRGMH